MRAFYLLLLLITGYQPSFSATISITINATGKTRYISPYIYGRNNCFNDSPEKPTPDSLVTLYREAGLRIFRENGGNNSTKYNWAKKLSSHPDWYNNVYKHDWGYVAKQIQQTIPHSQGIFALQLLGWAASNEDHNFDCWNFDKCAGKYRNSNFSGGVTVEQVSEDTSFWGDPLQYLQPWPADSTVGIFRSWFTAPPGGLGLDSSRFRYWNMDNEPEVWTGTHDDIADTSLTAEQYMQLYFQVAKKARALFPGIKLVGPVFTNEWQWWTWKNKLVPVPSGGQDTLLSWVEFFIKRIADEQNSSGIRLLDVIDFHFYPGYNDASNDKELLQLHRIFFDSTWNYPKSNGIHMIDKKWGTNVPYYFFHRVNKWLDHYLGEKHGVTIGMTEYGTVTGSGNATINALNYASMLGTFGREGVELFTPWEWVESWWEILHLFSRYGQPYNLEIPSILDSMVSVYPMIGRDTLTIIVLNRADEHRALEISFTNFSELPEQVQTLRLSNLPAARTFISHTNNALVKGSSEITQNRLTLDLTSHSITAAVLPMKNLLLTTNRDSNTPDYPEFKLNKTRLTIHGSGSLEIFDVTGKRVRYSTNSGFWDFKNAPAGMYIIRVHAKTKPFKFIITK